MKRFTPYFGLLRSVRVPFTLALLFGAIHGLASGFGMPFLTKLVLPLLAAPPPAEAAALASTAPEPVATSAVLMVLVLPLAFLVRGLTGFLNVYLLSYCGLQVLKAIQTQLYEKLQRLPLEFFQRHRDGDLMSRVLGDTSVLQSMLTTTANDLVKQPLMFLGAIGWLVLLSIREQQLIFIILTAVLLPLLIVPIRFTGARLLARARQLQDQAGTVATCVAENLGAIKEVRLFNLQESQARKFRTALEIAQKYQLKIVKYSNMISPTVEFVGAVSVSIALFFVAKSRLALEDLVSLALALFFTYAPLRSIAQVHNSLKRGSASLDRIEEVLNYPESLPDPAVPVPLVRARGEITFREVSFAYSEQQVLSNVNERIAPGEIIALVGPSGAGKTTFANLIPRLYEVRAGQVLVDGVDVRHYLKADLRAQIAIVPQDPVLFNDTIRNNILLGRPGASDEELIRAAQEAYAHDFIVSLEDSYETMVGERGTRVSGGQKQRIALARAFLKNAPILILDEATSNLDSESEAMIQKALTKLVQGRTTLIIAHRFSTLKIADRILFFEAGRLVAQGSHDELYATLPPYRSLYEKQF